MVTILFSRQCQAQYPNTCGAASFYLYGNYQNQEVLLHFIGINGNSYNGNASLYFYNALISTNAPIGTVVVQVVATNGIPQDGPATFLSPNSEEFQSVVSEVIIWGAMNYWYFNFGGQSEMNLEQNDFQQIYQGEWVQQLGIDAAYWLNLGTFFTPIAEQLSSIMGDPDAATQCSDFVFLTQAIINGYSTVQSNYSANAASVLNVLEQYGVVTNQNYSSAQLIVGLSELNTNQLSQFETNLFAAAYPTQPSLKTDAQIYANSFLQNFGAGAVQLGAKATIIGAETFYDAYSVYGLTASTSARAAVSASADFFASGLSGVAASAAGDALATFLVQNYIAPQADILNDMVYCQNILATNLFPELTSVAGEMTDNSGFANFATGDDLAAEIEAISSFEGLWCNLGAEEETNQIIQTQLPQYITMGPAFTGRAANMYSMLTAANSISQNLTNQSIGIPIPVISELSQTNGVLADEFNISGSNFCNAVAVYFNNAPTWFQVNSSTSISTVVPFGTGTVDIRVVGPGGESNFDIILGRKIIDSLFNST